MKERAVYYRKDELTALLLEEEEVICLDPDSHLLALCLGMKLLNEQMKPVAKVIKGY